MECVIAYTCANAHHCVSLRKSAHAHEMYVQFVIIFLLFYSNQGANLELEKIERGLQMIKKGTLPTTPDSIDDINRAFDDESVFDAYGTSLQVVDTDGSNLPQKNRFFDGAFENKQKQFSFCCFSSKTTIKLIEKHIPADKRHILMDATFRVVPMGKFNQLFILYIRKNKKVSEFILWFYFIHSISLMQSIIYVYLQVFPFAWILMDRRTRAAYEAVFKFIDENVLALGNVVSFTSDFERAMRNALKKLYPSIKRFTCHFHYTQALKRRASQTDGLVNAIRSDPQCR